MWEEMGRICPPTPCVQVRTCWGLLEGERTLCQSSPQICVRAPKTEDGGGMGVPFSPG